MKLRDTYSSLEALCDDMDVSQTEIEEKLKKINYEYDKGSQDSSTQINTSVNQFIDDFIDLLSCNF